MSTPSPERWTEFGVDSIFVQQSASITLVPTWACLTSGRAIHCRKNAFNSLCPVLRVDPLRLIIPNAAEKSLSGASEGMSLGHQWNWLLKFGSNAEETSGTTQQILCSVATNSALPLLSAIVDGFLLDAVIGCQPSLPRNHDAVPLTLVRSASPAQSGSPYVNTEPTGALFTASRLSVVGRIVMIPGFPRRYRNVDLMFRMSVSLARPRLDEAFPIIQRKSAPTSHNSFSTFLSVSRRSHRSVCELLSADMLNSSSVLSTYEASSPKLYLSFVFTRVRPR